MWRALTLSVTQYCLDTHWVLLSTETEMNDFFVISELLSDVEEEIGNLVVLWNLPDHCSCMYYHNWGQVFGESFTQTNISV